MKFLDANKLSVLAFVVIIVSNIVILYGVFANKNGEPTSRVTLTERELRLPYQNRSQNSAISLRIQYQTPNSTKWLTQKKLQELGFDIKNSSKKKDRSKFVNRVQKEVFLVLEYDATAYQEALALAKNKITDAIEQGASEKQIRYAKKELQQLQLQRSRLYAIDADTNAAKLREKYQDKTQYIIAKGLISTRYTNHTVQGYVSRLSIRNIYVPLEHSRYLKSLQAGPHKKFNSPRYKVTLEYGSRFEPYVTAVQRLKN